MLRSLFQKQKRSPARVPDDVRVYAIGDIHGCDDLFSQLLSLIDEDHQARTPKRRILILLGDLVDRGPDSAKVVARARALAQNDANVRFLAGNHEELLLGACSGDVQAARVLARNGGRETALSYGIAEDDFDTANFLDQSALFNAAIPEEDQAFLRDMEDVIVIGDYVFVHAGIRPGVPLDEQTGTDLRWIRDRFLRHRGEHEKFVIHGHTITDEIDEQTNRIGIDTGAYASRQLTAVALEGNQRWFLQT